MGALRRQARLIALVVAGGLIATMVGLFLITPRYVAIASILVVELGQLLSGRLSIPRLVREAPLITRWAAYAGFVLAILLFGVFRSSQFIYFQF